MFRAFDLISPVQDCEAVDCPSPL